MVDDREDQSESIKKVCPQKSALLGDLGKLWIKLKINPSDEDEQEQEEYCAKDQQKLPQSNKNITRICYVCNKGFRSGKALGGHMRIHFRTDKDLIFSKKKIKPSRPFIRLKKRKREVGSDFANKKDLNKSSNDDSAAAAAFPTCSICGKNFPSMKSLFGHMRCHPEREWRGIQPPPPASVKTSSLSSVSDAEPDQTVQESDDHDHHQVDSAVVDGDQTVDLTKSLGGWSVTAKRGRKAIADNSEGEEDEEMLNAVFHLMSLAQGDSCEAELVNEHKAEESEATNSISLTFKTESEDLITKRRIPGSKKGRKMEFLAGYIRDHPVKQLINEERKVDGFQMNNNVIHMSNAKIVQETDFFAGQFANLDGPREEENNSPEEYYGDKDCSDDGSEDSENIHDQLVNHKNFVSTNGNVMIVRSKKKRKRMKLRGLDSVHDQRINPALTVTMTTSPEKYRCSTCDKCFPTHQALGGHRSSHNKFRMVIQNSLDESTTSAADEADNLDNEDLIPTPVEDRNEGAASSHQCKICNRNFPTGQALGGHKRCHYSGQMEGLSSQVTSAGEASRTTDHGIMEFDLNEFPPLEDDAAGNCGCASSSFNSVEFPVF